jgi:hypothetical protein
MIFAKIFGFYDLCRHRRCHRRYGCGIYEGWNDNVLEIDYVAIADSNAKAIKTGNFRNARADSRANAFNINDVDLDKNLINELKY